MDFGEINSLEEVWGAASASCREGPKFNLLLCYQFPISLVDSDFVRLYEEKAQEWQRDPAPGNLFFSHGEYFRGEKGIQHVLEELRSKGASRRALVSLLDMDEIIGRGDEPIPSFMVLQFAFEGESLYVTAYFRALEVEQFLRVNIAEICLWVRRIRDELAGVRLAVVRLVILAFRAYRDPEFILERALMDREPQGRVATVVAKGDMAELIVWLEDKKKRRSAIETERFGEIVTALEEFKASYTPKFYSSVRAALATMQRLKNARKRASEGINVDGEYERLKALLDECIGELKGLERRGAKPD